MTSAENVFAANLRAFRAKANMTQEKLADRIGVDTQSIINWEKGAYMPSLRTTVKLADAFGISIDQLVKE